MADDRQQAGPEPPRADKRRYFVLMGTCIGLFVLSWAVSGPLLGARGGHHVGGGPGHPPVRGDHRERGQRDRPSTPVGPREGRFRWAAGPQAPAGGRLRAPGGPVTVRSGDFAVLPSAGPLLRVGVGDLRTA